MKKYFILVFAILTFLIFIFFNQVFNEVSLTTQSDEGMQEIVGKFIYQNLSGNNVDSVRLRQTKLPNPMAFSSCAENSNTHKIYCFGGSFVYQKPIRTITMYYQNGSILGMMKTLENVELGQTSLMGKDFCYSFNSTISCLNYTYLDEYNNSNVIFEYNSIDDSLFVKELALPLPNSYLSCAEDSSSNKIYCFGGRNDNIFYDLILEYDAVSNNISIKKTRLPAPRAHFSCVESSANHRIYCFGGSNNSTLLDEILEYDPLTDNIYIKNSTIPFETYQLRCEESSKVNKIYCFGGAYFDFKLNKAKRIDYIIEYDPVDDNLIIKSAKLPMPLRLLGCAENSFSGKIYCFGGDDAMNTYYDTTIEYDPIDDGVFLTHNLLANSSGISCAENSNTHKIYCFGGVYTDHESNFFLDNIIEYNDYDVNLF